VSAPILQVSDLSLVRDDTVILDGISWTVKRGRHWAVLGANGSGKTSLIAAVTGYLMPTRGEIDLLGKRFGESDWRALRTRIGIVSSSVRQLMADSEPALYTVASGRHAMIDYWGDPSPAEQRIARTLLARVEAGYLADHPWAVLSQGERQRILIARALMSRPRLLILDEPCAGLDPVAREHFLQFLGRLARTPQAPSMLLITHHVEEITPCFTDALLLREGRVVAAGPVKTTLTSEHLSQVFHARVQVSRRRGRYQLEVRSRSRNAI